MKRLLFLLLCVAPLGCASNADVSKLAKVLHKVHDKVEIVDQKVDSLEARVSALESGKPAYKPPATPLVQPASWSVPADPPVKTAAKAEAPSVTVIIATPQPVRIVTGQLSAADLKTLDQLHAKYDNYLSKNP